MALIINLDSIDDTPANRASLEAMLEEKARHDPEFGNRSYSIEAGDYTCIADSAGLDEYAASALLSEITDALRGEEHAGEYEYESEDEGEDEINE